MSDILQRILEVKHREIAAARRHASEAVMQQQLAALAADAVHQPRGFLSAIQAKHRAGSPAVISEVKRASPSKGVIRDPYAPDEIAKDYERGGAACLSVLTDIEFFQGDPEHLRAARTACSLPVLRKDFMLDPYQVLQARYWGADCILLIVAALSDTQLRELEAAAFALGMDVLVEVHDLSELERALKHCKSALIGVNNRNLRTFETRLETSLELAREMPQGRLPVSESGIHTPADLARLTEAGIQTFLIGEVFMRAPSPGAALRAMFFPS
jgi:indole-3-glycerol phosphate synthase